MNEINASFATTVAPPNNVARSAEWPIAKCFVFAWLIALAVVFVDCVWLYETKYSIVPSSLSSGVAGSASIACMALVMRRLFRLPRYSPLAAKLHATEICAITESVGLLIVFSYSALLLQDLCISLAPPLVDDTLIAIDAMLGFSWSSIPVWCGKHPQMHMLLDYIYNSFEWQILFIAIFLGATKRFEDLYKFTILFFVCTVASIVISAPIPASNPFFHFGLVQHYEDSFWSQFFPIREGTITSFDLGKGQGLVSMPSLHAAGAVVFAYALRNVKLVFPLSVAFNVTMTFSAIVCGAHYLVDIIAGIILAMASIAVLEYIRNSHTSNLT
ncbi:phosphatase PAP2 family protein [Paraburkholderia sacchari]|uniref:phosphatase PAP2 family protein n=1 Tax=Paraburkholderia sacchari TaxID=159450 RepID=UPI001BD14E8B|nr:phosphatase PAP2 family protein [Paraburkholderia sacchari]